MLHYEVLLISSQLGRSTHSVALVSLGMYIMLFVNVLVIVLLESYISNVRHPSLCIIIILVTLLNTDNVSEMQKPGLSIKCALMILKDCLFN